MVLSGGRDATTVALGEGDFRGICMVDIGLVGTRSVGADPRLNIGVAR
jgi:hypothetical protein